MDQLAILFLVGIIVALIFGGIALHSDYREKHPKVSP